MSVGSDRGRRLERQHPEMLRGLDGGSTRSRPGTSFLSSLPEEAAHKILRSEDGLASL